MKKRILFFAVFVMFTFSLYAQSEPADFLKKAKEKLEEGDCDGAQTYYNVYQNSSLKLDPNVRLDTSVQRLIEECKKKEAETKKPKPSQKVSLDVNTNNSGKPNKKKIDWKGNDFCKDGKNNFIAWTVLGVGYPWGLVSGLESRVGGIIGIGLYGDMGVETDPEDDFKFRYAAGIKFYPYNGLFMDFGYGTIKAHDSYSQSRGFLFHAGYNYIPRLGSDGYFFGVGFGASYDVINKLYGPSMNVKAGIRWK